MAAPEASQPLAELQRHAAQKPENAFKAFDTYPWQSDKLFTHNLAIALYNVEPNGARLVDIALQMRINRFAEKIKVQIDQDAYKEWLSKTGNLQPRLFSDQNLAGELDAKVPPEQRRLAILHAQLGYPTNQPDSIPDPEPIDPSVPSWQREAPKAELFVPKTGGSSNAEGGSGTYPKKFEEILKFLETGQAIPDIRQIPDTVIEDPSVSIHGTMQAPLKPWERSSGNATANTGLSSGPP
ncbi:hypothetical protein F4777DRAFT_532384 [Nemania sp. FL0916]|nr:hypothetical protein F4777DRAFT_532384 [Nemania sp. FL0916]